MKWWKIIISPIDYYVIVYTVKKLARYSTNVPIHFFKNYVTSFILVNEVKLNEPVGLLQIGTVLKSTMIQAVGEQHGKGREAVSY